MRLARPHPLLKNHLNAFGIEWCSVMDVLDWQTHWQNGQPPRELEDDLKALLEWIHSGHNADMNFMTQNLSARQDARHIFEDVETILSIIIPYATGQHTRGHETPGLKALRRDETQEPCPEQSIASRTARYARVADYHKKIKSELESALKLWESEAIESGLIRHKPAWRVVTDSIPFLDRAHARIAQLGFVGKNTMLIRPGVGSYFFIAHVLMDCHFSEISDPSGDKLVGADSISALSCGDCTRCLDACPTQAFTGERRLDANKCLSYLTIEHRGLVQEKYLSHFAEHFYGCDVCQDVCPYNLKTMTLKTIKPFRTILPYLESLTLIDVARMSQSQYEKWFGGSAMTRAKYPGLVRNALYSLHASNSSELEKILAERAHDSNPLICAVVEQLKAIRQLNAD